MKSEFKLIGLSLPNSVTLTPMDSEEMFWCGTNMPTETFVEMFRYCKGSWNVNKIALVEHEGIRENGTPINPTMLRFREEGTTPF